MDPLIIHKQIFNTSNSKDFVLLQLLKVLLSIFIIVLFGILANQVYQGNINQVWEQVLLPASMIFFVIVFNKVSPYKLFDLS